MKNWRGFAAPVLFTTNKKLGTKKNRFRGSFLQCFNFVNCEASPLCDRF